MVLFGRGHLGISGGCVGYRTPPTSKPFFFFLIFPQRIRATVNTQEQKRLLMDLDISMRTVDCFYTVTFYGALFREVRGYCCTVPWVCVCPLNAQNCLKPLLFPTAKVGWLRWYKAQLLQEAAGLLPCCNNRCPSMLALGWISSRKLLDVAVGSAVGGTPTSVPIVIRCMLVCGRQWLHHGDVRLPWVEVWCPSVCPPCVLWLLGGLENFL